MKYHDMGIARKLGMTICWIRRRFAQKGYGGTLEPEQFTKPDFHYRSIIDLANASTLHSEQQLSLTSKEVRNHVSHAPNRECQYDRRISDRSVDRHDARDEDAVHSRVARAVEQGGDLDGR